LWSIGGTIFSAVGFILLALFEQYNDSLSELRHDLKHFNESSADLVKKETMHRFVSHIKSCYKELQEAKASRKLMERELRASEIDRRELTHELQQLRERLASVEGRQAATPLMLPAPTGGKTTPPAE
jgi:chromosome segregation ATPase